MKSQETTLVTCKHCGGESKTVICTSCFLNYDFTRYECEPDEEAKPGTPRAGAATDPFDIERIEAL